MRCLYCGKPISDNAREFIMAPAYDMLPVNIVLPDDSDQLALTLNGKRSNLKRKDFLDFADRCEIKEVCRKM